MAVSVTNAPGAPPAAAGRRASERAQARRETLKLLLRRPGFVLRRADHHLLGGLRRPRTVRGPVHPVGPLRRLRPHDRQSGPAVDSTTSWAPTGWAATSSRGSLVRRPRRLHGRAAGGAHRRRPRDAPRPHHGLLSAASPTTASAGSSRRSWRCRSSSSRCSRSSSSGRRRSSSSGSSASCSRRSSLGRSLRGPGRTPAGLRDGGQAAR